MDYLLNVFFVLNILGMVLCVIDKFFEKSKRKMSKNIILVICSLGGIIGYYIFMRILKCRENEDDFRKIFYPILLIWLVIYIFVLFI